jgi:hypothetical protein
MAEQVRQTLPCIGAWVSSGNGRSPLLGIVVALHADDPELQPDAAAAAEFEAQLECPDWLRDAAAISGGEAQYAVRWEGGSSPCSVWAESEVRQARLPCTREGEPLFAKVLHGDRQGELGLVVALTPRSVRLRFQTEYPELAGRVVPGPASRKASRIQLRSRRSEELRVEFFVYKGGTPRGLDKIDSFFVSVFLGLELQELLGRWPACREIAESLLDPEMDEQQARSLIGALVHHVRRDVTHEGRIRACSRSILEDGQFYIHFEADGDSCTMRA